MIGMSFSAFLTLSILGLISAFVLHVLVRYRMLNGLDGFLCKWIAGWAGAWLASPVFGHWSMQVQSVYLIPAILGAFVSPFLVTALVKASTITTAAIQRPLGAAPQAVAAPQFDIRKAS